MTNIFKSKFSPLFKSPNFESTNRLQPIFILCIVLKLKLYKRNIVNNLKYNNLNSF